MKKIIIIFILSLFAYYANSNPLVQSFKIMSFTYSSASQWSINCEAFHVFGSSDSIVVRTSQSRASYSLIGKNNSNESWLITPDSLNLPLSLNKDSDIMTVTFYPNIGFLTSDSITFGSYPKAMFVALKDSTTLIRSTGCEADDVSSLHYDKLFTLKGKVYDKYGAIVPNALFFSEGHFKIDATSPCMADSFMTNANGEYKFQDYQDIPIYSRKTIWVGIENVDKNYLNIQEITIADSEQTIANRDIHILDDLTKNKIISDSKFSLFPNPAGTQATLNYLLPTASNAVAQIVNLQGVLVESLPLKTGAGSLVIRLDSKYRAGMYIVRVVSNKNVLYSQQLIINK
jgi:hypothetical protein